MAFPEPFEGKLEEGSRSILERRIEVSRTSICVPRNLVMFSVAKRGLRRRPRFLWLLGSINVSSK